MSSFNHHTAIVMGATSGMGLRVATLLLQMGWRVGVSGRRLQPLINLKSQFGSLVEYEAIDVTADNAEDLFLCLAHRLGHLDLYFHSSGFGAQNTSLAPDVELSTISTNSMGFVRLVGAAFRLMRSQGGGHIACITSVAATRGLGAAPAYSASKAMQRSYIQALSQLSNAQKLGISFSDIRPGFVDTDFLHGGVYPLLLNPDTVASSILSKVLARRRSFVIDWRYSLLVFFWRLIPSFVWERLNIKCSC